MNICIGMFGTCDGSNWRENFKKAYKKKGIKFFDPNKDDWSAHTEKYIREEAEHLANDEIVLFPILGWSLGQGSLSEMGFGPLKAIRSNKNRSFIVLIEEKLHPRLDNKDEARRKDSIRSRKIVKGHLKDLSLPNLYIVDTLEEMLEVSFKLYVAHAKITEAQTLAVKTAG